MSFNELIEKKYGRDINWNMIQSFCNYRQGEKYSSIYNYLQENGDNEAPPFFENFIDRQDFREYLFNLDAEAWEHLFSTADNYEDTVIDFIEGDPIFDSIDTELLENDFIKIDYIGYFEYKYRFDIFKKNGYYFWN